MNTHARIPAWVGTWRLIPLRFLRQVGQVVSGVPRAFVSESLAL